MSSTERIIVRWLSGLLAAGSAALGALVGFDTIDASSELIIGLTVAVAAISALIASVTTEAAKTALAGMRK